MRAWLVEQKVEREREKYKQDMWNKVNGWLKDYDEDIWAN